MKRIILLLCIMSMAQGQWIWTPETGWINKKYDPRLQAQQMHKQGQEAMKQRQYARAITLFLEISEKYPNTPEGKDSLYLIAQSFYITGFPYQAYLYYEQYREKYPATPRTEEILAKEYEIGSALVRGKGFLFRFDVEKYKKDLGKGAVSENLSGVFRKRGYSISDTAVIEKSEGQAWLLIDEESTNVYILAPDGDDINVYRKEKNQKFLGVFSASTAPTGVEILSKLIEVAPYADFADDAQLTIANYYFRQANYEEAQDSYLTLLEKYPESEWGQVAQYQMARCSYLQYRGYEYDSKPLIVARNKLEEYRLKYKDNSEINLAKKVEILDNKIREKLAEKELETAIYYMDRDELVSAKIYFYTIVKKYPRTPAARRAHTLLQRLRAGD